MYTEDFQISVNPGKILTIHILIIHIKLQKHGLTTFYSLHSKQELVY